MLPVARNNYIISLISNAIMPEHISRIYNELSTYGIKLVSQKFRVALIVVDSSVTADMNLNTSMTITIAVNELIDQMIEPYGKCYVANMINGSFAILFNLKDNIKDADIYNICDDFLQKLYFEYGIDGHIYLGNEYSGVHNINKSYEEAKEALSYRYVYNKERVLAFSQVTYSKVLPKYSIDMEIKLENMLRAGNIAGAEAILDEIYEINFVDGQIDPQMAQCLMIDIFCTILRVSENLGIDMYQHLKRDDYQKDDDNKELMPLKFGANVENTMYWFKLLFGIICDHINTNYKSKDEEFKSKIIDIIESELSNPNLNQSYIAEKLNVSAPYLSCMFKEIFGVNMSNFISKKRSERAARLLKETSKTLNDIVKEVGVLDAAALIRIFKKIYGITPGQYRRKYSSIDI